MARIEGDDILGQSAEDRVKGLNEQLSIMLGLMDQNDAAIKEIAASIKTALGTNAGKTAKEIAALNKLMQQSNKNQLDAIKNAKERENVEIQASKKRQEKKKEIEREIAVEDKAFSLAVKKKKETERQIKLTEKEIKLQEKQVGTLNKLRIKNTELVKERSRLNLETKKGRDRLLEINRTLDANNRFIEKNTDALGRQRIGIGRYEKAARRLTGVLAKLGISLGFGFIIRAGTKALADFDEALADIRKTTGLTADEAERLSLSLLKIDTRTSIENLQQLAVAAGRLGIKGVGDIRDFVESTDKLFVALSDDIEGTAEEIGTMIGKIASLSGAIKKFGVAEALLKVGSVINGLAANTKATANQIVNFTNQVGGIAAILEIPIQDIASLGATLDAAGVSTEVSGTAISNALVSISKNIKAFADFAGEDVAVFRKRFEEDAIGVLRDLTVQAKNSGKGFEGFTKLLETFGLKGGKRATQVFATLAKTAEEFSENQALGNKLFEEGTSLTDEFDIKNKTLTATWEKLTNRFKKFFLESASGNKVVEKLKNILKLVADNLGGIITFVSKATKAFLIYNGAVFLLTKGLKLLRFAQNLAIDGFRKLNAVTKVNLIAAIATAIFLLIDAIRDYNEELSTTEKIQKNLNDVNKEAEKNIITQQREISTLVGIAKDHNQTLETREKAIKRLNEISPDYLGNITLENIELDEGITILENYNKELLRVSRNKIILAKIDELQAQKLEEEAASIDDQISLLDKLWISVKNGRNSGKTSQDEAIAATKQEKEDVAALDAQIQALLDTLNEDFKISDVLGDEDGGGSGSSDKEREKRFKAIRDANKNHLAQLEIDLIEAGAKQAEISFTLAEARKEILISETEAAAEIFGVQSKERIQAELRLQRQILAIRKKAAKDAKTDLSKDEEFGFDEGVFDDFLLSDEGEDKIIIDEQAIKDAVDAAIREINRLELAEKKRLDNLKKASDETLRLAQGVTDGIISQVDSRIDARQRELDIGQDEITRLREIGTANALLAAEAQERQINREKLEIEALEKRRRNLLIIVTGLELANKLIQGGDVNGFQNANTQLTSFLNNLPKFEKGTEKGTLGDQLGNTNTTDGHLLWADDGEKIFKRDHVDQLKSVGLTNNSDIVKSAMAFQTQGITGRAMRASVAQTMTDKNIVAAVLANTKAIKEQVYEQTHYDPITGQTTHTGKGFVKTIYHDTSGKNRL